MAKNRVIYQSDALFVSKSVNSTGANDHEQLRRVQSANYSLNITRQDVNQFGQLARLEAIILEAPTVSFDMSYYLGDGYNEQALNFLNSTGLNGGFVSGQIQSTSGQNFYILTAPEGVDANFNPSSGNATGYNTIGIGNAFLTDYSLEASVGSIPTISASFEGTNMNATAGVSGTSAGYSGIEGVGIDPTLGTALDNQVVGKVVGSVTGKGVTFPVGDQAIGANIPTALRPGDITLSLAKADGDAFVDLDGAGSAHVQSVSISIPLGRTPIDKLGSRFSFARVVDFPITPTLAVSAIVSETQTAALTDIINDDAFIDDLTFTFKDGDSAGTERAVYKLTNLKLDSQSYSSSIGPNKTVDLNFSLSIGGPNDDVNNVFFSGSNTRAPFDSTAPVISLVGATTLNLSVDGTYSELGATTDDGTTAVVIDSSAVDMTAAATYTVTYNATDADGNVAAEVTRSVVVS